MSLSPELRAQLELIRSSLADLAQEHPDTESFLEQLKRRAETLLEMTENDDQRHAVLAELSLMACEAGIPGETARHALMGKRGG